MLLRARSLQIQQLTTAWYSHNFAESFDRNTWKSAIKQKWVSFESAFPYDQAGSARVRTYVKDDLGSNGSYSDKWTILKFNYLKLACRLWRSSFITNNTIFQVDIARVTEVCFKTIMSLSLVNRHSVNPRFYVLHSQIKNKKQVWIVEFY